MKITREEAQKLVEDPRWSSWQLHDGKGYPYWLEPGQVVQVYYDRPIKAREVEGYDHIVLMDDGTLVGYATESESAWVDRPDTTTVKFYRRMLEEL